MNITHLKYAIEVLDTKSITKASQNLYMGQPNLSKALKDFEKDIGITLFIRTAKGVEPTEKGLDFLLSAKRILSQFDNLEKKYSSDKNKCLVNISVPRCASISKAFIDFFNIYKENHQIIIKFRETSAQNIISDVMSSQADFGIVRYHAQYENHFLSQITHSELSYKPLYEFKLSLLMHKSHPLSQNKIINKNDLDKYIEVAQGDYYINKFNQNKSIMNKRILVYDRASQYDLLREIYGTYMWVSNIPYDVLNLHDFVIKKCDMDDIVSKDVFIYKNDIIYSKKAINFIKCLKITNLK